MEILIPILFQVFILALLTKRGCDSTFQIKDKDITVRVADSWIAKRIGLLNHSALAENSSLLIKNSHSVHTVGMAFAIDIVFLDKNFMVLKTETAVPPGIKQIKGPKQTRHVLEKAAHSEDLAVGSKIELV